MGRNSKTRSHSRERSSTQQRDFNQNRAPHQGLNCTYCQKSGHRMKECRKRLREQGPGNAGLGPSRNRVTEIPRSEPATKNIRTTDEVVKIAPVVGDIIPMIELSSRDLNEEITMLIVIIGMTKNILKIGALKSCKNIDTSEILNLKLPTGEILARTLGSKNLKFFTEPILFHIVDDDFPIAQDGIVTQNFFRAQKETSIDFVFRIAEINGQRYQLLACFDDPVIQISEQNNNKNENENENDELLSLYCIDDSHEINSMCAIEFLEDIISVSISEQHFSREDKLEIDRQVAELLDKDIIERSDSPYDSPVLLVPAKGNSFIKNHNGKMLVVDYRILNEKIVSDDYPLPKIIDILENLGGGKYFSILVIAGGFYSIPLEESSAPKTAFSTRQGHFQFKRLPPGLKNGSATFQRLMDEVFEGLLGQGMFAYLGSIIIYTDSFDSHLEKLREVFERLKEANLTLDPEKCEFSHRQVVYLGHLISERGMEPDPKKIEEVTNFPRPKSVKQIRQFLGLAGFYRRFLKDFSKIAKPLTSLYKKGIEFQWTDERERAFQELRKKLCSKPMLHYPNFKKPFVLTTEAFEYALGGALSQIGEKGKNMPISFASRLLNTAEENYSKYEKEILAVVYAVEHYRSHLFGKKFTLVTDRQSFDWLNSIENPPLRIANWKSKLAEFEYKIANK